MFDPGSVGEWSLDKLGMISPPQSPRWGDNRGEEKKIVYSYSHTRKHQNTGCACGRKQSFRTPHKTNNLPTTKPGKGKATPCPYAVKPSLNPNTNNRSNLSPPPAH